MIFNSQKATVLNLLLRSYIESNLYDQADKLISKSTFPDSADNNQTARYMYYQGLLKISRIKPARTHQGDSIGLYGFASLFAASRSKGTADTCYCRFPTNGMYTLESTHSEPGQQVGHYCATLDGRNSRENALSSTFAQSFACSLFPHHSGYALFNSLAKLFEWEILPSFRKPWRPMLPISRQTRFTP